MDMFFLVLNQLLMMAFLMVVGYLLMKKNIVPKGTGNILSKLETFIFVPALSFTNQIKNCTVTTFKENSRLILYGFCLIIVAMAMAYPISRLFVKNYKESAELQYKRNVYKYALTFANYGFIGNFVVLGIWGNEVFFRYTMFTLLIAIVCCSWGLFILIPKGQISFWQGLKKGFLTPPIIALVLGIIIGLLDLGKYVPSFAMSALDNAAKCMGPVAMVLAGMVIAEYDVKKLVKNKTVYVVSLLRLIVIPTVFVLALKALGTSDEIMTFALIAFATPLGMNTIVYPAAFGGDTETGASMTVISSILSIVTIPILYYLLIVLL